MNGDYFSAERIKWDFYEDDYGDAQLDYVYFNVS